MRRPRISWLVLIVAVITVLAVPGLREQARVIPLSAVHGLRPSGFLWNPWALPEAVAFVDRHYPNDPDMLLAVGSLALSDEIYCSPDEPEREELLRLHRSFLERAVAAGGTPAAWAAYAESLRRGDIQISHAGPPAPGVTRPDPDDEAASEAAPETPSTLPPGSRTPLLTALREWQAVDPENALPMVLEALELAQEAYRLGATGLGSDALSLWLAAGSRPIVSARWAERREALGLLWQRMGLPEMEAREAAVHLDEQWFTTLHLSFSARGISRAGVRAASEGRPEQAVRLWQATVDLGRHMQMSADSWGGFQTGVSLEQIGADPIWQLYPRYHLGMSDEQQRRGSFWHGSHHALYVEQMGEEADEALRDRLLKSRAQYLLLTGPSSTDFSDMQEEARASLAHFVSLALSTSLLLALFGLLSVYGREAADRAADIGLGWRAALVLAPLPLGYLLLLLLDVEPFDPWLGARTVWPLWVHAAAIPFAVLVLSLGSIMYRHAGSASMWAVWRGNMRAVLPSVAALVAVYCVVVGLDAAPLRARATEELRRPRLTRVIEELGDRWHNPPIPPNAWRAEYPPEETTDDHTAPRF